MSRYFKKPYFNCFLFIKRNPKQIEAVTRKYKDYKVAEFEKLYD